MSAKPPATVVVAPYGGVDGDLYSSISDAEFHTIQIDTARHLKEVEFSIYCEWMFNVKEGDLEVEVTVPEGSSSDSFRFERNETGWDHQGDFPPFHYIADATNTPSDGDQIFLPENPVWKITDDGSEVSFPLLLLRCFFHRGKFYFIMSKRYEGSYGEGESTSVYTATKTKLEVVTTGTGGDGDGYANRDTWTATDTFF